MKMLNVFQHKNWLDKSGAAWPQLHTQKPIKKLAKTVLWLTRNYAIKSNQMPLDCCGHLVKYHPRNSCFSAHKCDHLLIAKKGNWTIRFVSWKIISTIEQKASLKVRRKKEANKTVFLQNSRHFIINYAIKPKRDVTSNM